MSIIKINNSQININNISSTIVASSDVKQNVWNNVAWSFNPKFDRNSFYKITLKDNGQGINEKIFFDVAIGTMYGWVINIGNNTRNNNKFFFNRDVFRISPAEDTHITIYEFNIKGE